MTQNQDTRQVARKAGPHMKRRIILAAALLLAAVCAVWIVTHQMQSPYAHLHYDKYISVSKQDKPQIEKATVTDKEVREEIDRQLAEDATDSLSQGKVKDGDTVIISYSGKINGKPFDGSDASERSITIGSEVIPEFEKAIKGEKTGRKVTAKVEYPSDYGNAQIAGQTADYEIFIEGIQEEASAKYTDSFVKKKGFADKKEYEQSVRKELLTEKQRGKEKNAEELYWARMLSCAKMLDYPTDLVKEEAHNALDMHKAYASAHGMSWNTFLSEYLKTDEKSLNRMLTKQARQTVKEKILTYKLAKEKNIRLSNREYQQWKEELFKETNKTEESVAADYGIPFSEYEKKTDLRAKALQDKVKKEIYQK